MLILDAFVLRLLVSLEIFVVFWTLIGHAGLEVQEPICFVIREVIAVLRWLIP